MWPRVKEEKSHCIPSVRQAVWHQLTLLSHLLGGCFISPVVLRAAIWRGLCASLVDAS